MSHHTWRPDKTRDLIGKTAGQSKGPGLQRAKGNAEHRFWSKVIRGPLPEQCWIWVGAIADDGYGRFYLDGTSVRPHRYSLALDLGLAHGQLPELMHECDVPLCVNPRHLGMGDRQSNMVDRQRKLRSANGSGLRFRGLPRAAMAARSRALREDLLAHGWDVQRIHAINAGSRVEDPTLF
ncbi:hypothetical protein [Paeniglutamicibacter gangotriensis]|uniref:HNH nuclease domain-containing protein n=1 Tax=Paeniglutamicibacter gangotriensis Lz1y TaxID=1276920 RepID=M7NEC1_9MICC|nr:hypothetical protein [Paeniglutamicibacter gangotriensis]EMQ96828.1 hypothetical protein ADIAG_03965 [Paeniglutamicibacter gangotriensis Lz1y]